MGSLLALPSGTQSPEITNGDCGTAGVEQLALEVIVLHIESINRAVTEIPNKKIASELSKARRCDPEPPRRIERSTRCHPVEQMTFQVELVHKAVASTGNIVLLVRVLQCECNEQMAIKDLDIKGRIALWQMPSVKLFTCLKFWSKTSTVPLWKFAAKRKVPSSLLPIARPL